MNQTFIFGAKILSSNSVEKPNLIDLTGNNTSKALIVEKMVYTHDWKRKYFVLTRERLYYYESENSQGGERGSGVIDLKCLADCVEAPLTDHKKATNVFILIAKERGFFDQVF